MRANDSEQVGHEGHRLAKKRPAPQPPHQPAQTTALVAPERFVMGG